MERHMKKLFTIIVVLFISTSCATTVNTPPANTSPTPKIIFPTPVSCTSLVTAPTPGPESPSVFPAVTAQDRVRGASDALFTITDYSDYQDPRSALLAEAVNKLLEDYPN